MNFHFYLLTFPFSWEVQWEEEEEEGGEKVSLKTHVTARGVGKNM